MYITGDPEGIPYSVFTEKLPHSRKFNNSGNQIVFKLLNKTSSMKFEDMRAADSQAVECWIKFCESELTLTDGSDLNLLDSFKLWGEDVFGW